MTEIWTVLSPSAVVRGHSRYSPRASFLVCHEVAHKAVDLPYTASVTQLCHLFESRLLVGWVHKATLEPCLRLFPFLFLLSVMADVTMDPPSPNASAVLETNDTTAVLASPANPWPKICEALVTLESDYKSFEATWPKVVKSLRYRSWLQRLSATTVSFSLSFSLKFAAD